MISEVHWLRVGKLYRKPWLFLPIEGFPITCFHLATWVRLNMEDQAHNCEFNRKRKSDRWWSTGWWFGTCFMTFHILGTIIPFDFHIFQRGRYTMVYHQMNDKAWRFCLCSRHFQTTWICFKLVFDLLINPPGEWTEPTEHGPGAILVAALVALGEMKSGRALVPRPGCCG